MHPPILLLGPLAKRNRQEESVQNCSDSPFNNYETEIQVNEIGSPSPNINVLELKRRYHGLLHVPQKRV
jgi:hypothetical protein